jgi:hypothetical protein
MARGTDGSTPFQLATRDRSRGVSMAFSNTKLAAHCFTCFAGFAPWDRKHTRTRAVTEWKGKGINTPYVRRGVWCTKAKQTKKVVEQHTQ